LFGAGAEQPAWAPGNQGGGSRSVRTQRSASRQSSQSMARFSNIRRATLKLMCRSDTSRAWHATSVVSVAYRRPLETPEVIFSKWLRSTVAQSLPASEGPPRAPFVAPAESVALMARRVKTWYSDCSEASDGEAPEASVRKRFPTWRRRARPAKFHIGSVKPFSAVSAWFCWRAVQVGPRAQSFPVLPFSSRWPPLGV
jgi:hypothetical protein